MRSPDLLHLVRLESARVRGWQLRLPAWHPRSEETTLYSDSAYGGPEAALLAARQARDAAFTAEGLPLRWGGHWRHRGNRSGIVGITLTFRPRSITPSLAAFSWDAKWVEGGRQRRQAFALHSLGFGAALLAAIEKRTTMTGMSPEPAQVARAMSLRSAVEHHIASGIWERPGHAEGMTPFARRYVGGADEDQGLHVPGRQEPLP